MVKIALLICALVAATTAAPNPMGMGMGGVGVVAKNTHVTTGVVSPYMGMGYGMMAYPGVGVGSSVASHSISSHAAVPAMGMGGMGMGGMGMMKGIGMGGMYPGGIGMGYGLMG